MYILVLLKFTPLEFETIEYQQEVAKEQKLKFTPLEFETMLGGQIFLFAYSVKIYSVGV